MDVSTDLTFLSIINNSSSIKIENKNNNININPVILFSISNSDVYDLNNKTTIVDINICFDIYIKIEKKLIFTFEHAV